MRIAVVNLGCKVNRVELDHLSLSLARRGHEIVDPSQAQLIVINTCAVTTEAEKKTRKAIRKAAQREQEPLVLVAGCSVSLHPQEIEALHERVSVCLNKFELADRAEGLLKQYYGDSYECQTAKREELDLKQAKEEPAQDAELEDLSHRRLGIKIQDGCDNRCSYCIIWKARGKAHSLDVSQVLDQVHQALDLGVQELVLTGINLGTYQAYYHGSCLDLADLIELIMQKTKLKRLRLSSLEPLDLSKKLLECMKRYEERVCQHLHLALQSGCDKTLREMNRIYNTQEFAERIAMAREFNPLMSFSTDLIVAFPGESDEDFKQSYDFCKAMRFSKIHTFRYSARPGTPAALRSDQIDGSISAHRSEEIRKLAEELRLEDARMRLGTNEYVLVEEGRQGTSGSYHKVEIIGLDSTEIYPGDLVQVHLEKLSSTGQLVARYIKSI